MTVIAGCPRISKQWFEAKYLENTFSTYGGGGQEGSGEQSEQSEFGLGKTSVEPIQKPSGILPLSLTVKVQSFMTQTFNSYRHFSWQTNTESKQ